MKKWENINLPLEERAKYYVKDMSKDEIVDEIANEISSVPVLDICENTPNEIYREEIIKKLSRIFPPISCVGAMFSSEHSYDAAYYFIDYALDKKILDEKELDDLAYKIIYHKIQMHNFAQDRQSKNRAKEKRISFSDGENIISQSTVLLKNNKLLPLAKDKVESIAIIGPNANCAAVLTGDCDESSGNTVFHGLLEAYPSVRISYAKGCGYSQELNEKDVYEAAKVAEQAEIIVLAMGLTPEIEKSQKEINAVHLLPKEQIELMEKLHLLGKPMVLLNFTGMPIDLSRADDLCDSILQCWYPYKGTDEVIAKMLFNDCHPTGKLPFTIYKSSNNDVLYPFGYGLNYSEIEYYRVYLSNAIIKSGEDIVVTIYAKNKGRYDTKDTVQAYLSDEQASVQVPEMKLVAAKLVELPKEKEIKISIRIKTEDMAIAKADGKREVEPGRFSLYVGSGQPDNLTAELCNRDCLHIGFLVE